MLVIKRDGSSVDFDIKKIENAIDKAFVAVDRKPLEFVTQRLALLAISKLNSKAEEWKIEDIQDSVEYALVEAGFSDVAKAYILYRQSRSDRRAGKTVIDYKKIIENYVDAVDWRVKENSTVNYSIGGLILNASGAVTANYWLSEVYDKEIGEAHKNGDMHIHDLSMLAPYCFTGDTVVRSLDGKNRTFEQLVKDGVRELWVYAYDHKNNCIVPAKAINPRITRKTNKLVRVKFTGGVEFTCTPDHPIMLRNGEYIKAEDIKPNMSVMPLYVSEKSKYCRINKNWVVDDRQQYVHRWVLENKLGRALGDDEVAHHLNGDKHDNRPENLDVMMDKEHRAMEVRRTMETDNWKRNNNARLVSYNRSPEKRAQVSAFAKDRPRTVAGTFAYMGRPYGVAYNHCVRSVKKIELEKAVKVYDLTVPGYENFAVAGGVFVHNCAGWSLKQLIREGLGGVPGKIASKPATHLSTLCNQMVNFLGIMQNEWAGAQAFSSFDTYLAAFVKKDNLTYKQVKQCIQSFIYGVNTPSRWGTQAPFSNITLDWNIPEDLKDVPAIVGGKDMDFTYGDCQKEADMVNRAFIEVMTEGDANGRGFQYPIPTYSITKDFNWSETENNKALFEMAAKYGTPYFSNYVNSDMQPSDVRSMCPLHPDEKVLISTDYNPEWHVSKIDNLENRMKKGGEYNVILNGKVKRARLHRFDNLPGFRRITLSNGTSVVFSNNHENLTLQGVKTTDKLTVDDYLPFNTTVLEGKGYDYDDGYIVGAFLGDGSLKDSRTVVFSLNNGSKKETFDKIKAIVSRKWGAKILETFLNSSLSGKQSCVNLAFHSACMRGLIEDFVEGSGLEKAVKINTLSMSSDFRRGIIDGYMATDGGNNNRIYTASEKMVESFKTLCASLGKTINVSVDNRDSSETLSDNPVYCMRIYEMSKETYKSIYKNDGTYAWFRITDITPVDGSFGYCFEVLNDDKPYFMLPSGLVTHNCRLRLDLRDLRRKNGGFFGSGDSTGSVGVVTINMPRIGYLSTSKEDFFEKLDHMMDIAARSLKLKRNKINELLEKGLYPYTKRYLGTLANHFSTIGLVGMNEACLNAKWLGKNMTDPEAQKFAEDVLDHMRERLADYQEMYPGDLYNLEATPAESTAFRLAKHDLERFPDIITSGTPESPYYTNSTNLPVGYTDDIWKALDVQDRLQPKYTSGTVFHTFLGQRISDWRGAMNLIRAICSNYRLPYISLSPTYSVCQEHGYLEGEQAICPHCGRTTEIYSRITGYYRAVQNWNPGKVQEYKERKEYDPEGNPSEVGNKDSGCESCDISDNGMTCEKQHDPEEVVAQAGEKFSKPMLFTTPTCPNCPTAKAHLTRKGIEYDVIDATQAIELVERYGIQSVPTLVADGEVYRGLGAVMGWINKH